MPKNDEEREIVSLSLTKGLKRKLKIAAAMKDLSVSEFAREIIENLDLEEV